MNVSPFFYCIVFTYNPFLQNQYFTESIFYTINILQIELFYIFFLLFKFYVIFFYERLRQTFILLII